MKVLAIDPGYASCGWALVKFEGQSRRLLDAGKWETATSDGSEIERVGVIVGRFTSKLECATPDAVGLETFTFQRKGQNMTVAMGMTRVIDRMRVTCEGLSVPCYEVTTSQAKAAIGLSGNVPKERVRKMVSAMFGMRLGDHEADAVAVAVATYGRARIDAAKRGAA